MPVCGPALEPVTLHLWSGGVVLASARLGTVELATGDGLHILSVFLGSGHDSDIVLVAMCETAGVVPRSCVWRPGTLCLVVESRTPLHRAFYSEVLAAWRADEGSSALQINVS